MTIARNLFVITVWIAIVGLSVYFFSDNVLAYFFGYRSQMFGNSFWNNRFWVVLHMTGGTLALFAGPSQFWKALRNRYPVMHRYMGYSYIAGVAMAGAAALRMSLISSCIPCRLSLFVLTLLALSTTYFAYRAIRARNVKVHRQMMVRSYILMMAFVAVRLDSVVPLDFLFGRIEDPLWSRVVQEYFFSFVPLIMAEFVMVWYPSVFPKHSRAVKSIK